MVEGHSISGTFYLEDKMTQHIEHSLVQIVREKILANAKQEYKTLSTRDGGEWQGEIGRDKLAPIHNLASFGGSFASAQEWG